MKVNRSVVDELVDELELRLTGYFDIHDMSEQERVESIMRSFIKECLEGRLPLLGKGKDTKTPLDKREN